MTSQEKAFEIIEKARKQKQNQWQFLDKAGFRNPQEYIDLYNESKKNKSVSSNTKQISYTESKNSAILESKGTIKTVDELLAASEVDLNIWEVVKFTRNKWEVVMREPATTIGGAGNNALIVENEKGGSHTLWTRNSSKPLHEPLFQVKIWLKRKAGRDNITLDLIEYFKKEINAAIPKDKWNEVKKIKNNKKYCLELSLPDSHLGKLAWSKETRGADYDSKIAVELFDDAVNDLISKSPMNQVDTILLGLGGDYFHTDDEEEKTTAGTYVGIDTRWQKVFVKGITLLCEVIARLANDYKVHVPIIPGNHDFQKSFYMGEYLRAFFRNNPNVFIDNEPTTRKYFRYGNTLLGFCHGSEEKIRELPLIMAKECKEDWSQTKFQEIHLGHKHSESNQEYHGVKVRILPSLCASDSWHSKKGYISTRSAIAFLWDFEEGLVAQYYHNI